MDREKEKDAWYIPEVHSKKFGLCDSTFKDYDYDKKVLRYFYEKFENLFGDAWYIPEVHSKSLGTYQVR